MPIHAIIFDFGGVLMRTEDRSSRRELAGRLGISYDEINRLVFDTESARLATLGQLSAQGHWEAVRAALRLSPEEFASVPAAFWSGDVLDIELVDFIRSLRRSYRTALLSNAWDDLHGQLETEWNILDAFDVIVISSEVGLAKPDPAIFHLLLDRLGVAPAEAVFVDDFTHNVEAAQSIGMHAIRFRSANQVKADLERLLHTDSGDGS